MAGILDKKSRIFDTIITDEGRRQMYKGELQVRFVAFSDAMSFYQGDEASGSADAQSRIYLEAVSLPQDQITFEADDSGKLTDFKGGENLGVIGGKILSGSEDNYLQVVTGSQFASLVPTLLSSSFANFEKLRIIATEDFFLDSEDFRPSRSMINFIATKDSPIPSNNLQITSVLDIEALFQDKRLSHIPNFRFLPPINKPSAIAPNGSKLGNFIQIGQKEILTFSELMKSLEGKPSETIEFLDTSRTNNIMAQFFEIMPNEIRKLDIIDFGSFPSNNPTAQDYRVFFAGKIFIDGRESHTFVNLFTLIFS